MTTGIANAEVTTRNTRKLTALQELSDIIGQLSVDEQRRLSGNPRLLWNAVESLPVAVRRRVALASPYLARRYCVEIRGKRWEKAEKLIWQDAKESVSYAQQFNCPMPGAEDVIAQDPKLALAYADVVSRYERWHKGEKAIATNGKLALEYVSTRMFRFIEAEPAIIAAAKLSRGDDGCLHGWDTSRELLAYIQATKPGGWPEVEQVFIDTNHAMEYVTTVLRGRFDLFEREFFGGDNDRITLNDWNEYVRAVHNWGLGAELQEVRPPRATGGTV